MIQIKTITGWKEVSREQAKAWVEHQLHHITAMNRADAIVYLNKKIKGTTVEELINEHKANV